MLITVAEGADVEAVQRGLQALGLWTRRYSDGARVLFEVERHSAVVAPARVAAVPGVASVALPTSPHPRLDAQPRRVVAGPAAFAVGGPAVLLAGPCAVESRELAFAVARAVAATAAPGMGGRLLRGGAFKPRTSPYAFAGHGEAALAWLREAADAHGLGVVSEAVGVDEVAAVAAHADLVQVGSRNMQHYPLLKAVGRSGRPVLLKRGAAATVEEWLLAAEHLLHHGAAGVVLCERGVRGFDPSTRNLLDLGAVAHLTQVHHLPVVVDPSHATGRRDLVLPLARAAVAAGAAGVMVEVHPRPEEARSDGPQALDLDALGALARSLA